MKARSGPSSARAAVIEESGGARPSGRGVAISHVADPSKLLASGSRRLHGDVVDALVDLVVALLDEEAPPDEGSVG